MHSWVSPVMTPAGLTVLVVHAVSITVKPTVATTASLRIMPIGSIGQGLQHPRPAPIGRVPERATEYGPAVDGVDEIERGR